MDGCGCFRWVMQGGSWEDVMGVVCVGIAAMVVGMWGGKGSRCFRAGGLMSWHFGMVSASRVTACWCCCFRVHRGFAECFRILDED